ncbi:hypothetical protein [Nocardioides sp. NPDC047086]|uniref:hypothetical protein n=1 Tax=Nocardioides sp. NPDC047086 TaxID=3154810 RepID=UPI0034022B61
MTSATRLAHERNTCGGTVTVEDPGTAEFTGMPGDGDRFVWLNGTLLDRLWTSWPQRRLYAPAPLWQSGANQVVVLDLTHPATYVEIHPDPDFRPSEEYVEFLPTGNQPSRFKAASAAWNPPMP